MITINTAKGLCKVDSWEDLLERPGFIADLNPNEHQLDSVIGRYVFGDMVKCGLSNCHTLHARGYIVATKKGRETNIGKDCGKKYFGLDFDQMAKQFDTDLAAHENRELLWSFAFQVDELESKIAALRTADKGADWVQRNVSALTNPAKLPLSVTRQIGELVKQKSGAFTLEREATAQEAEDMEQIAGRKLERPLYVTDFKAEIHGIEALYPENDLRDLLMIQILDELKAFKKLPIDDLTSSQLTRWKKWATSVDLNFDKATASVDHGRVLLKKENLSPLSRLLGLDRNDELERFNSFLDQLG